MEIAIVNSNIVDVVVEVTSMKQIYIYIYICCIQSWHMLSAHYISKLNKLNIFNIVDIKNDDEMVNVYNAERIES